MVRMAEIEGLEPSTFRLTVGCSTTELYLKKWLLDSDSNWGSLGYEPSEIPTSLPSYAPQMSSKVFIFKFLCCMLTWEIFWRKSQPYFRHVDFNRISLVYSRINKRQIFLPPLLFLLFFLWSKILTPFIKFVFTILIQSLYSL